MIRRCRHILCAGLVAAPLPLLGMTPEFLQDASLTKELDEGYGSYRLPIGPWAHGEVEAIWAEGDISRKAWRFDAGAMSTLEMLAPMRGQLEEMGFDVLYECQVRDCGGFDFRFSTDVLSEPEMHVDLGDFRFLSAQRMGEERPEYVSLLVSRGGATGYVQMIRVGPAEPATTEAQVVSTKSVTTRLAEEPVLPVTLAEQLEANGLAVLDDLDFGRGSSKLVAGDYPSLTALADYLKANPTRKVTLVGHTDSEGGLNNNVALSKKRADSVLRLLVRELGVPSAQVKSQGVGYLSPRATNLTENGREQNRRVEVILTSIE